MKTQTITNLILTSSILFFSACSNKTPSVKQTANKTQSLSAYNIIGIDRSRPKNIPLFIVAHRAKTAFHIQVKDNPIRENIEDYPEATYISDTPKPIYDNITSYPTASPIPIADNNSIEVISYAQTPNENLTRNRYSNDIEVISYGSQHNRTNFNSNTNTNAITNEVEAKAKSFLGTKYVWGATGPSKSDCSGFTQWVYRDAGITLPRVSKDQALVGNYVQYADLRRGDMVFFATKKHQEGKVTHVGIYLGNNNFIHASSAAKKVVIYNFDDKPYYKEHFLWGRRVINSNNYLASR